MSRLNNDILRFIQHQNRVKSKPILNLLLLDRFQILLQRLIRFRLRIITLLLLAPRFTQERALNLASIAHNRPTLPRPRTVQPQIRLIQVHLVRHYGPLQRLYLQLLLTLEELLLPLAAAELVLVLDLALGELELCEFGGLGVVFGELADFAGHQFKLVGLRSC